MKIILTSSQIFLFVYFTIYFLALSGRIDATFSSFFPFTEGLLLLIPETFGWDGVLRQMVLEGLLYGELSLPTPFFANKTSFCVPVFQSFFLPALL